MRYTLGLMLIGIMLVTSGCGSTSEGAASPETVTLSGVLFPQQVAMADPQTYPTAEMSGTLLVVNQCLRVINHQANTDYLPICNTYANC